QDAFADQLRYRPLVGDRRTEVAAEQTAEPAQVTLEYGVVEVELGSDLLGALGAGCGALAEDRLHRVTECRCREEHQNGGEPQGQYREAEATGEPRRPGHSCGARARAGPALGGFGSCNVGHLGSALYTNETRRNWNAEHGMYRCGTNPWTRFE